MVKFEVGKTYYTRMIGDSNAIVEITVAKRTAKTITTSKGKTLRTTVREGAECVAPQGRHSMAPTIAATDTEVLRPEWETASKKVDADTLAALSVEWSTIAGESLTVIANGDTVFTREVSEAGARFLRTAMVRGRCSHTVTIGWRFYVNVSDLDEMRARYTAQGAA